MAKSRAEKWPFSEVDHVGVIVSDINKAVQYYEALGIGPFEQPKELVKERKVLGKPISIGDIKIEMRVAQIGPVRLELIEPVKGKTFWMEFLETKGEGINHIGFCVNDIDRVEAKLGEQGLRALYSSRFEGGGGVAHFDTREVGGIIFEVIQRPTG